MKPQACIKCHQEFTFNKIMIKGVSQPVCLTCFFGPGSMWHHHENCTRMSDNQNKHAFKDCPECNDYFVEDKE